MILLTGGSGFIGRYLIKRLEVDYKVKNYDLNEPAFKSSAVFVKGDVTDKANVIKEIKGCESIIHLAAVHHDTILDEKEFYRVNVEGARNIVEALDIHYIKRIVFYSSVAVYGNSFSNVTEDAPPNPMNPYGKSKLEAENIFIEWAKSKKDNKLCIIRPSVVIGPYNYANMFKLIKQIDRGLYIHIGRGKNIKSVSYVENLAEATIFLLKHIDEQISMFNYADEPQLTSRQIVDIIGDTLKKKKSFFSPQNQGVPHKIKNFVGRKRFCGGPLVIPYFAAYSAGLCFDVLSHILGRDLSISSKRVKKFCSETFCNADKIRQSGFKPLFTSIDGIKKMVNWYLEIKGKGQGS